MLRLAVYPNQQNLWLRTLSVPIIFVNRQNKSVLLGQRKEEIKKMMRTTKQVKKVIPGINFPLVRLMINIKRFLLEKHENSFGIYADVRKFKEEIEGFPASLYESCKSCAQAHKYLEEYLHQEKGNQQMEVTAIALAALKKTCPRL
jgi:DNA repair exonuclease SbcCD ATPase subunit